MTRAVAEEPIPAGVLLRRSTTLSRDGQLVRGAGPTGHEIAALCRDDLSPFEMLTRLQAPLSFAIGYDALVIAATDPSTTLISTAIAIDELSEDICALWLRNEFVQEDCNVRRSAPGGLRRDLAASGDVRASRAHTADHRRPVESARHRGPRCRPPPW